MDPKPFRTTELTGLIHHTDRGSQYTSIRFSERLADVGIAASVGTVGDSYDCESVDRLLAA